MTNSEVLELLKDAFELKRQLKYKRAIELLYKALTICPDNVEILVQVAELHMLLKNPASACAIYEKLIEQQPDNSDVVENLVKYYINQHKTDKARVILAKYILAYPSDKSYSICLKLLSDMKDYEKIIELYEQKNLISYHNQQMNKYYAIALYGKKRYQEAVAIFEKEAQEAKHDELLHLYYAQTLFELNEADKANTILKPFLRLSEDARVFNLCGEAELRNENYEVAINLFSQAVKLKYGGLYFYNLATAYFLSGQFKEANNFYLKAISASPEVDEYRFAQAYVFYKQGELNKAKQIVDAILARNAGGREAVLLSAQILFDENKYYFAEKQLNSFTFSPDDADYLKLSAKIAKALYKYDDAKSYLENYVTIYTQDMDERYELARLCFDMANFEQAAKLTFEIVLENPKYIGAYILAAKIYIKMFDFEKVISMSDKALALDLNNEEAFYLKAIGYLGLKEYERSIETAKKLLDYNPSKVEAYALLGSNYSEINEIEAAIKYYEEALMLDSHNIDYYVNLASLYEKTGNKKEALRYLNMANVIKQDNKDIVLKLAKTYKAEGQYKQALKLLCRLEKKTKEQGLKKELKLNICELDKEYKNSVNPLKYFVWHVFKV